MLLVLKNDSTRFNGCTIKKARENNQREREKERNTLTEASFCQLHNKDITSNDRPVSNTINTLMDKNDHCLFDWFTSEV